MDTSVCLSKHILILPENQVVAMCTLACSCLVKHKELLWTVRPVVSLPSLPFFITHKVLSDLGILTEPEDYVLENIENLSKTRFAHYMYVLENIANLSKTPFAQPSLFHKYTAPQCKPGHTSVMEVMVKNVEALNKKWTKSGCDLSCLKIIPCIPVNTFSHGLPVLVKPQHVIFTSNINHFYPFLHSAPPELYSIKPLLREIGIADSLQLEHVQDMLQQVFEIFHSMEMDQRTLKSVTSTLKCLISLLKESKEKEEVIALKLDPLYLLATDKQLHHISKLVYCDNPEYQLYSLNLAETGLNLLQINDNILHIKVE